MLVSHADREAFAFLSVWLFVSLPNGLSAYFICLSAYFICLSVCQFPSVLCLSLSLLSPTHASFIVLSNSLSCLSFELPVSLHPEVRKIK